MQLLSLRLTFAVYILHMDPDTFYLYFYNMNFNTHALEKISAYFYMAHPYDCTPIFPSPPLLLLYDQSLKSIYRPAKYRPTVYL